MKFNGTIVHKLNSLYKVGPKVRQQTFNLVEVQVNPEPLKLLHTWNVDSVSSLCVSLLSWTWFNTTIVLRLVYGVNN